MRILAAFLVVAIAGCASSGSSTQASEFHSWYHGYFLHSIWGIGKLGEYEGDPYVLCGNERVPIRAVFDTHMYAGQEPRAGQTQADVTLHNQALVARFAENGITCKIPEQWAQDA